jgi:hypothetical protein
MISDVMDGADVGVIQCRGRTGFAPETAQGIRMARELFGQKLERYKTMQPSVFGS